MQFETFDSVFDALSETLAGSANMKARFELLSSLEARIRSWNVSRDAAASRLDIPRLRLDDILRGDLRKFSLGALINLTAMAR